MTPTNGSPQFSTPAALSKHPNIFIGGMPGAGKTSFLGSVGKGNRVLIADPEGGTATFRSAWFQGRESSAALDDLHVMSFGEETKAQEVLFKVESALDYLIRTKNSDGYALFAVDSLTELQEQFMHLHPASDRRQAYGAFRDGLHTIIHKAKQAPLPTIFTARLKATYDEVQGREIIRPEISPGAWGIAAGLFDNIGLFDLKAQGVRTTRSLEFAFTTRFPGKDRLDLGALTDPTFEAMVASLNGETEDAPAQPARKPVTRKPAAKRPGGSS